MNDDDIIILDRIDAPDLLAAMRVLKARGVFDHTSERYIEGVCSSDAVNAHGYSVNPDGATWECPVPLLWRHKWNVPIGLVDEIKQIGSKLHFKARIANSLPDATGVWAAVLRREALGVSTGQAWLGRDAMPVRNGKLGSHFDEWRVGEVSLCPKGANPDAWIDLAATFERPKSGIALRPYDIRWRKLHFYNKPTVQLRPVRLEAPTP